MQQPLQEAQKTSVVVAPNWMGDIIMIEPLLRSIKSAYPQGKIVLLGNNTAEALLPYLKWADSLINFNNINKRLALKERFNLAKELKALNPQRAYITPNSYKSALIPFFANIPYRVGYLGEHRYGLLTDVRNKGAIDREVDRFTALAFDKNATLKALSPRLEVLPSEVIAVKEKFALKDKLTLAIAPGAEFGPSKKWTQQGFDAVLLWAKQRALQTVILGSKKDAEQFTMPKEADAINLLGKTNIGEALAVCRLANSLLCHDSGLMHAASALSTDVVALYGPTSEQTTPPLPLEGRDAKVVSAADITCRPCFKKTCPLGHHHCMTHIAADRVINLIDEQLAYG